MKKVQHLVDRFWGDSEIRPFLLSLGSGANLCSLELALTRSQPLQRHRTHICTVYLHTSKLPPEGVASNQPESRCCDSTSRDPDRAWNTLKNWELVKSKISYLDNLKGSRDSQELGQGWIRFISDTRPLLHDWERWRFHLLHRNKHSQEKWENTGMCFKGRLR